MRVVLADLIADARHPADSDCVSLVHDLLWAHASVTDGLEHVRVRSADHGMDVFLFMRAPSDADALSQAQRLLCRARRPLRARGYGFEDALL
ncbi:hypothetical protein [Streptomyces sp. NPDC048410]|uniref:hypothetical protein n=1 Tax=Streptomyces sp. NPDC048410 TaxID=3365545 RepID=UPI0037190A6A